ncbi:hypothetical protein I6N90_15705 [Paenibacillus sp. GSMTC-2017]|uniref:hypothetical protein n=1 Tax=Paenibacillus sp. GSMTC-2017 TaxID=2794350 RepID=UPI0018D5F8C1|nr:hypothetical protein [Paenibacillus sp. GSMTC-2017]MBH5319249.1 hypothetical protein [Paenibacillus sp. GSMTC-2017]
MKKLGLSLIALIMMLSIATSASATPYYGPDGPYVPQVVTNTYNLAGGTIFLDYSAFPFRQHGFLYIKAYRVTTSGDVLVGSFELEGGRPNWPISHSGTATIAESQPAGTYKFVITFPPRWILANLYFHN